jgi:2-polyprenyl-6-methoxyphenol hydroxylase-like FAD-dependent oxidoreductase
MVVRDYDAVVVGARVAGATLATLLGQADYRVLLVDRATFPSATLSTHFFRGAGLIAVLERLGALDDVLALGCPPLVHDYWYDDGAPQPTVGPPQDPGTAGYCLSVRREPLDALLVGRMAALPSVEVMEQTRLVGLVRENGRVNGAQLAAPDGEVIASTRIVIGADGRHSAVARAVAATTELDDPPIRAIYYRYLRGFGGPAGAAPNGAEFSRIEDELAYVFPSDDGVTCVACSINRTASAQSRTAAAEYFAALLSNHRGLVDRFKAATPEGRLLGSGPLPSYVRVPAGPGWALVGDAGMHLDPWTGYGMDLAGTHATYLAEALLAWFGNEASEEQALATYHKRRNAHGLPIYHSTQTIGRDLRQLAGA